MLTNLVEPTAPGPSTKTLELFASLYTNLPNLQNIHILIKSSFAILL